MTILKEDAALSVINENPGKKPFVLTVCSGKGGVGKSVLAANLAQKLSEQSLKVLIWDADMQFPNQHILLGVEPPVRLVDVYLGNINVKTALFGIDKNLYILADMPATGKSEKFHDPVILNTYNELLRDTDFDVLIIDTPAGNSYEILQCSNIADLVSIVITDEPTSLLDAYGLIKILLQYIELDKMTLLVNNVIDWEDADDISTKLNLATQNFLKVQFNVLGFVPYDRAVRQSILQQEPFTLSTPEAEVSKAVHKLAKNLYEKILSVRK